MFLPMLSLILMAGLPPMEESLMTMLRGMDLLGWERWVKSSGCVSQIHRAAEWHHRL